mmetsp:Transcript_27272/g.31125  ORF Transcript_27272/g.31125 Transcript_27272/m.31125 type:complete len:278 (+) Transcript_27272:47-880(+)
MRVVDHHDESKSARNGKRKRSNEDSGENVSIQSSCKINDEMIENTRSLAKQRRERERRRRTDFSETLDDLSEFIFTIDPNLKSGRSKSMLQSKSSGVNIDSTKGKLSSSVTNRQELVQCSTRLLRRLHKENQDKDKVIAELNSRIDSLLNQHKPKKQQQQELEYQQAVASLYARENRKIGSHLIEKPCSLSYIPHVTNSASFNAYLTASSPSILAASTSAAAQRQLQLLNALSTTNKTNNVFQNLSLCHPLLARSIMDASKSNQQNLIKIPKHLMYH